MSEETTTKRGRGRPRKDKLTVTFTITHAQFDECLRYGPTIQKGIEYLINRSIDSQDGPEPDPPNPEAPPPPLSLRWICKHPKCYIHPANFGAKCTSCGYPKPRYFKGRIGT